MRKKAHIFIRYIEVYHVGGAVVGNLTQEHCQFRHFDVGAETLFTLDCTCHVQFIIGCFLRKYRRPRIEARNLLTLQFSWSKVLKHHIQFGQGVHNHRARKECCAEVTSCPVLNVTDGKQQVHRPLRAFGIAYTGNPRVACLKH